MFVEVDSVGRVSGGGGECKHEIRDCTCPGVQNPKSAGIRVGDESGNDVVGRR
jgi:hypothetical protein